jgi:quercetin dioxygenase-like cupin family protein
VEHDLTGWDIQHGDDARWMPWGGDGAPARAKVLGSGDGYVLVLVEAEAGYVGQPHTHAAAEMSYVVSGAVEHQGVPMHAGDGYVAAAGSVHTGFTATTDASYVLAFKL